MIYNAGYLNRRIKIMTTKTDDTGDFSEEKPTVLCTCWAAIQPLRGREYYDANEKRNEGQIKITIRFRHGIDAGCSVLYQSHTYNINSVVDINADHSSLELYCTEVTRGKSPGKSAGGWET